MASFKVLRGNSGELQYHPIHDGYSWFCEDTGEFFIDVGTNRVPINAEYAKGLKRGSTTIGVVTSVDTSVNLPTSNAVKKYVDTAIGTAIDANY